MQILTELFFIFLRTVLGFSVLLLVTRLIGNKQLGQLSVFTYISGISIGSMAVDLITHWDVRVIDALGGIAFWGGLTILVEYINLKSARARVLLGGEPLIIIKHGKILRQSLKKHRLNIDDLTMLLRTNDVFSIQDIEYAILEPNGDLSVIKTPDKNSVTLADLGLPAAPLRHIPAQLIADGKVIEQNLRELGVSQEELERMLLAQQVTRAKDVFYAELQPDHTLYIQAK